MKNLFAILLFVTLGFSLEKQCNAQNFASKKYYLIDSLNLDALTKGDRQLIETSLKKYHTAKDDTTKIKALNGICENMMHEDWVKYQFYQHELIENNLLKGFPSKKELQTLKKSYAASLNNIGFIHQEQGQYHQALEYFYKSLKIQEEIDDKDGISISLNNIGHIYQGQGQIKEALNCLARSLKIAQEIDDKEGEANTLGNISFIYQGQGQIKEALDYYKRSLKIQAEIGDKRGMAISLGNIGSIYQGQGQLQEAIVYYERSLKLEEEIGDRKGISTSLLNIGSFYHKQGNTYKALEYFERSLKLKEEIEDKVGIANTLNNIGSIFQDQGNSKKALDYFNKSIAIAQEIGYPKSIEKAALGLSVLHEKKGEFLPSLTMYKLHIKMRDSLNNEKNQKEAIQQQAKYEYEKQKAIDDAEHEKEIAIEQEAKEKQTILTYATGGGLGLVGLFLLIVFNRLKVTRKQKNIIEEQKQEVEHQKEVVEQAHSELEEKNKEITDSIQYAKRIQNAILPPNKLVKEYLKESFILYKPKDIVAGDFYWLEQKDNKVLFAAADCTGHGVPGAMVSVVCNNGLNRSVREYGLTDPGEILNKTREIVVQEFEKSEEEVKDGMDIALCSLEGNKLQYAGANNPLWIIRNGELLETKANKQPIGKFDNPEPYTTHTIELQKGDSIYIFSDGFADQFGGEKGKKLKTTNFKKLLFSIQNENIQRQKGLIDEAFEEWKGNLEQLDDVCVIGVKI